MKNSKTSSLQKRLMISTAVFALVAIGLGVLLHFLLDLSGGNFFVALFSAANESIWEHLKLIFFPFEITMLIEYFIYGKEYKNFFSAKLIGVLSGMAATITLYYTFIGITGKNIPFINISIFVISTLVAYLVSYVRIRKKKSCLGALGETVSILILAVIWGMFFYFTYYPPEIPLFRDPMNMLYGITG